MKKSVINLCIFLTVNINCAAERNAIWDIFLTQASIIFVNVSCTFSALGNNGILQCLHNIMVIFNGFYS